MQLSRLLSLGFVIGLALTLSACGGKDEKKDGGNNGGTSDTKKKPGDKIVGKWTVDIAAMTGPAITMMEAQLAEAPEEAKADIAAQIAKIKEAKMEMEFTDDGKMIGTRSGGPADSETQNGIYEIKSSEENSLVLGTKMGDDDEEEVKVTFVDDDTIEITAAKGPKITAKRVK
jgi:hypothetical protein